MNFQERLKLYMIGFLIGLLMVYILFGNRSCMSLSEVKISQLRSKTFKTNPTVQRQLKCLHKTSSQLKSEIEFFEIDFDKSRPREKPCRIYYLQPKEKFRQFYPYHLIIKECNDVAWADSIIFQKNISCR